MKGIWKNMEMVTVQAEGLLLTRRRQSLRRAGGSKDSNANLAFTKGNNVYVNTKDNGISSMLDNTENMKSTLFHEKVHQERGQGFIKITNVQHAFVYGKQILDKSFETTTKEFKIGTIGSLEKLLKESSLDDLNEHRDAIINMISKVNDIIKDYGYQFGITYNGNGNISSIYAH